ncbi:MAG: ABC transporter permease, partial [Parcubacteria group bacterium]
KRVEEKVITVGMASKDSAPPLAAFLDTQEKVDLVEAPFEEYESKLDDGSLNVYLGIPESFESDFSLEKPVSVTVYQKSSNVDSFSAFSRLMAMLQAFNQQTATERLGAKGVSTETLTSIVPMPEDVATAQERGGFFIGFLLPMFIVMFAITGGQYIAIDVSAGEKERKTLEALLFVPVSRFRVVMGKYLAVATTSTVTIILSLVSLYVAFKVFPPSGLVGADVAINLSPAAIGIMLAVGIILAIMFAGLLLSVAIFAKSYKEAQNYISPFYLVAILPVAILNSIPDFKPTEAFFTIPGVNAVFVMKELLLGVFDVGHILITTASLAVFAGVAIIVATKIYSKEGILFRD